MKHNELKKLTPVNGFDKKNRDNAKQNNYAWSMAEFDGYLYVGTGRNIVYLPLSAMGDHLIEDLTPKCQDNAAEIWRMPIGCKDGKWERVYKAHEESGIFGFRVMQVYCDKHGRKGLIAGCISLKEKAVILVTFDGKCFEKLKADMPEGSNSRCMIEYQGKLYCGINSNVSESGQSLLMVMDCFQEGFKNVPIPTGEKMPCGDIMSFAVFDHHLYIGTILGGGFGVWKIRHPDSCNWRLVIDKGAGEGLNEWAMSMEVYKDRLYIGTGILYAVGTVDPNKEIVPFKGFDIIRVDCDDYWEVVVGSAPILPTHPCTGKRKEGRYPSGFGNMFNSYCWQIKCYNGRLYVGSWDSHLLFQEILISVIQQAFLMKDSDKQPKTFEQILLNKDEENMIVELETLLGCKIKRNNYQWLKWITAVLLSLKRYPKEDGFDLYCSEDGDDFKAMSLDGFCNPHNYGLRNLVVGSDDKLYIGTANPWDGCEVWSYWNKCPLKCHDKPCDDRHCHDKPCDCDDKPCDCDDKPCHDKPCDDKPWDCDDKPCHDEPCHDKPCDPCDDKPCHDKPCHDPWVWDPCDKPCDDDPWDCDKPCHDKPCHEKPHDCDPCDEKSWDFLFYGKEPIKK